MDDRVTVGVLLPLSGKLRGYGERAETAARLAAGELDDADSPIRLVFMDSAGGAANAVDALVRQHDAAAIVGPLFRDEALPASERAQALGVPLVALTSDPEAGAAGAYAFHAGLAPNAEIEALVAHATDVLGLRRFAILHPQIEYADRMRKLFTERVEERGGQIVAVESYDPGETTFTMPVRRLVGRADPTKHPNYARLVAECRKAPDDFRRKRCKRNIPGELPPIIEFDALFIPDTSRRIALVAPAVIAEDVVVERDPKRLKRIERTLGRKVEPIRLLGTSAWNDPDLPRAVDRAVEHAVFADVPPPGAKDGQGFKKHLRRSPNRAEQLVYDAVRFVADAVRTSKPTSTNDLRGALHDVRNFRGLTGKISFESGTLAERDFVILTIENGAIRPLDAK